MPDERESAASAAAEELPWSGMPTMICPETIF
jgi:hypothetical protein